jgi:protein SCO1/2/putative membrane protein
LRALLVALCCLAGASCAPPADEGLGPVGPFSLTERSGRTVTDADLRGKVWVASFQFTRCTAGCPQVSETMQRLQKQLHNRPDVLLVTFTVDPTHDDPRELQRYAERYGAEPDRWLFLTGTEAEVYRLLKEGFHVHAKKAEKPERGKEVDHSLKLVLVDRQGAVRGYYDGMPAALPGATPDEEAVADYERGLRRLVREVDVLRQPAFLPRDVPRFNATLNACAAVLLVLGWVTIRQYRALAAHPLGPPTLLMRLHVGCMLTALAVSTLFLASYLYYHLAIKLGEPTRFSERAPGAPAWVAWLYAVILGSHTVLAVLATPLAVVSAYLGLRRRWARHVWVARWALPVWLYVSVTGVVVYWMLYRLYPGG